jgi:hypothetical protein
MLTIGFVTDPEHWRERAEDMRLTASSLKDEGAKTQLLKIAEGYEALSRLTEERFSNGPIRPEPGSVVRSQRAHSDWRPSARDRN